MPTQVQYIKSAVLPQDYPKTSLPEIAFAGRSNAGKSSLINLISETKVAHVSQQPGKTRLLSFFNVREKYVLVDMPGYGFSKRSGNEQVGWEKMVETYIVKREQLKGLVLVMDVRREWTEDEEMLKVFLERSGIPMMVCLTKVDKVSRGETDRCLRSLQKKTGLSAIFPVSTLKRVGQDEVEDYLFKNWVRASK
jgi:GTP-binding protein